MLREMNGYESANDAARAIGRNITTYAHHENGRRNVDATSAVEYAQFFGISPSLLLFGEVPSIFRERIDVVGILDKNAQVIAMPHDAIVARKVAAPPILFSHPLHAVAVVNNDLYPMYREGDVIYFQPGLSPGGQSGKECVVQTRDETLMIRFVTEQPNGLYTLTAHDKPPLPNQDLIHASPVLWVQRNGMST